MVIEWGVGSLRIIKGRMVFLIFFDFFNCFSKVRSRVIYYLSRRMGRR